MIRCRKIYQCTSSFVLPDSYIHSGITNSTCSPNYILSRHISLQLPKLKPPLKRSRFDSRDEITQNATTELNTIPEGFPSVERMVSYVSRSTRRLLWTGQGSQSRQGTSFKNGIFFIQISYIKIYVLLRKQQFLLLNFICCFPVRQS